jgi:capsular exopolysaccharide synthesis family protein
MQRAVGNLDGPGARLGTIPTQHSSSATAAAPTPPGLGTIGSLLCRRYRVLVLALLLGICLAGLYWFLASPVFQTQASILLLKKDRDLPGAGPDAARQSESPLEEDSLATYMQMLTSEGVVRQALQETQLDQLPSLNRARDAGQTAAEYVLENLHVTRGGEGQGRGAQIVHVAFHHGDAADCERVLRTLIDTYRQRLDEMTSGLVKEALQRVLPIRERIQQDLQQADEHYLQFLKDAPLLWNGQEQLNVYHASVAGLENTLNEVRQQRIQARSRLETIKAAATRTAATGRRNSPSDLLALIDQQDFDRLTALINIHEGGQAGAQSKQREMSEAASSEYQMLLELYGRLGDLREKYGPEHPECTATQQKISILRKLAVARHRKLGDQLQSATLSPLELVRLYVNMLRNDLQDQTSRQQELERLLVTTRQQAKELEAATFEHRRLEEERARHRGRLDEVEQRVEKIRLASEYGPLLTRVLTPVEEAEQIAPRPAIILALGAFVGLCLGGVAAVTLEQAQSTFVDADDVHHTLGLPLLAQLPTIAAQVSRNGSGTASRLDPRLVSYYQADSAAAESVRGLRTLLSHQRGRAPLRTLQVTSPGTGDGKSLLAANLAISWANAGKRVLLVDADLRHPSLERLLAVESPSGLSDLLSGQATLEEAVRDTVVPNLSVLTAGSASAHPAECFSRPEFPWLLSIASQAYEVVVLDSPGLLAASEAAEIATRVDACVLTLDAAASSGQSAVVARNLLLAVGATIAGVVLNAPASKRRGWFGPRLRASADGRSRLGTDRYAHAN